VRKEISNRYVECGQPPIRCKSFRYSASSERQGRHISYRLHDNHVAELIDQALSHVDHVRLAASTRPVQES
jgi:hypothetical protein